MLAARGDLAEAAELLRQTAGGQPPSSRRRASTPIRDQQHARFPDLVDRTGKRVNGRKRHIAVDTCGWLMVVLVTGAGVQDHDAGRLQLWVLRACTLNLTVQII